MNDDTHMSEGGIRSVGLGLGRRVASGFLWVTRACDGQQMGTSAWCKYDLVLTNLYAGAPVPQPGQLPTCPGCAVALDEAMEASQ